MPRPTHNASLPHQRGAALVIGLILLLVLTVLAISGVNSASLEFFMAGNEQYRQNAFQAAETGIERAMVNGQFVVAGAATAIETINGNNSPTDAYTAVISKPLGNQPQPALWGNSWNSFSSYHFDVTSTGTAVRSSRAVNVQGVASIAPFDSQTQQPGSGLGNAFN
ncbi:MAG: pilus assembly PilX N-terminal domain-containing protein [Steroidobacteraceae bacterium]